MNFELEQAQTRNAHQTHRKRNKGKPVLLLWHLTLDIGLPAALTLDDETYGHLSYLTLKRTANTKFIRQSYEINNYYCYLCGKNSGCSVRIGLNIFVRLK